jgi:hypothetical protein
MNTNRTPRFEPDPTVGGPGEFGVWDHETHQIVGRSQGGILLYSREGAEHTARILNQYEEAKKQWTR